MESKVNELSKVKLNFLTFFCFILQSSCKILSFLNTFCLLCIINSRPPKADVKVNSDLKHAKEALKAEEKKKKEMNKNISEVSFFLFFSVFI